MSRHSKLTASNGIHTQVAFIYTSPLLRVFDTGLVEADIGKIALQSSDNTYWLLMGFSKIAIPSPIWINVSSIYYSVLYGDGYDGNLTLSGSTTVTFTRDMYYDIVTIPSGITGAIYTNGFQLFCNTLDLRGAPANSIKIQATFNSSGATLPTINNNGILLTGVNGPGGANGGLSAASLDGYFVNGGNGGNGGGGYYSNAKASGNGGTLKFGTFVSEFPTRYFLINTLPIYGGQPGGQGGGQSGGVYGGAAGAGAGVMRIFAKNIITDGSTAVGCISIEGGNGGNGEWGGGAIYQGGGGGGGGGGYLEIWYESRTGSAVTNLINASGGAGGNVQDATYARGGSNGGQGSVILGCTATGLVTSYIGNPISSASSSGASGAAANSYYISF